jgi:DNA-binding MarR family transcriptional regulator
VPDSPPWLNETEAEAWLALAAVAQLLPARLDSQLDRDANLTFFEYFTLAELAESPDLTLRITELAAQTHATVPRLSRVVTRLEEAGLVRRTRDDADGRGRRAQLTSAGVRKLDSAAPGHVATVRRLFTDCLTQEQLAQVGTAWGALLEVLDPGRTRFARTREGRRGRAGLSGPTRTDE